MLPCGEKAIYSPQNMRRIITLLVIQNNFRRFLKRRKLDELERQAQYVFVLFLRFMSSSFYQFHAAKIHNFFNTAKYCLFIFTDVDYEEEWKSEMLISLKYQHPIINLSTPTVVGVG